jgi:hypothetical protein
MTGFVVAALLFAGGAAADEPAAPGSSWAPREPIPMQRAMHTYFEGELAEGWVFAGAGVVGLGGGVAGLLAKDDFYNGAAFPLLAVGAIQLAAGVVLFARTGSQVAALDRSLTERPRASSFYDLEVPRMERVRTEFRYLEIAEIALAAVGIGIATYGGAQGDHFVLGIGAGLVVESSLMLALDQRASARADVYSAALHAHKP